MLKPAFHRWRFKIVRTVVIKPRVIVANPPFEQKGGVQEAANFVKKALSWINSPDNFRQRWSRRIVGIDSWGEI